ncbi:MAG: hypothetical protein WC685_05730 [Methylobacter sp.]|jgi:hypothetical protein
MHTSSPLLSIQQGKKGAFVSWLETLGLKDFISRYPLPKLVEWGWLVPQYRIVFPSDYFLTWQNFPEHPARLNPDRPNFDIENSLWDSTWSIDDDQKSLWFLHPFFHPDNACGNKLHDTDYVTPTPIPDEFIHPYLSEHITPYADYYFHWQAYALIDIVRSADCFVPIINTPDVEEYAQDIVRIAARVKEYKTKPSDVLKQSHRWGGLAESMTWLSHYCALRAALPYNEDATLHKKGAKQLAAHLSIDAEILEGVIEKLLALASSWLWENERYCAWTLNAWPYLQKDIMFAVEWLGFLSDKKFSFYLDKWKWTDFQRHEWAELHKVLPYEFFEDRQYFLRYAPIYNKKQYKGMLPIDENLNQLVSSLQATNYPFDSFLYAFRQLHENLMHNPKQKGSLDFRVLRPLDYYSLLAIRAEACLRFALENDDSLASINNKDQKLDGYIIELAKQKRISNGVIEYFKNNVSEFTQLRETPSNPIGAIMEIQCKKWSKRETYQVQAFLCCVLARNYFAHHTYLDKELIRDEKSDFMLTGIIVTVAVLLDNS